LTYTFHVGGHIRLSARRARLTQLVLTTQARGTSIMCEALLNWAPSADQRPLCLFTASDCNIYASTAGDHKYCNVLNRTTCQRDQLTPTITCIACTKGSRSLNAAEDQDAVTVISVQCRGSIV